MTGGDLPVLLIVCHEATRTGGARVIADLLERALPHLDVTPTVRLLAGGPLADRLRALGGPIPDRRPAAVLVNSALAAEAIDAFGPDVPVLVYVHEEGAALDALPDGALRSLTDDRVRVLCVSVAARDDLVAAGVPPEHIQLLRPIVTTPPPASDELVRSLRASWGAGPGTSVVMGCGEAGWRKGADLFVDLARRLAHRPDLQLVWVGRRPRGTARQLDHDLDRLSGLATVRWVGEVADVGVHLAAADVVVMPSREDPQPLVPLEAALAGTPTVGFDIGGLRELALVGAAATAPYPDTTRLTAVVEEVLASHDRRDGLVAAARRHASRQAPEAVVGEFVAAVERLLDRSTAVAPQHPGGRR